MKRALSFCLFSCISFFLSLSYGASYNANDSLMLRNFISQDANAANFNTTINFDDMSSYYFASWVMDSANSQYRISSLNFDWGYSGSLKLYSCDSLKTLSLAWNNINQLDVFDCPSLKSIDCRNNQITELSLDSNLKLKSLNLSNNQLYFSQINSGIEALDTGANFVYSPQKPLVLGDLQKSAYYFLDKEFNPLIDLRAELCPFGSGNKADTSLFIWHILKGGLDSIITIPQREAGLFDFSNLNISTKDFLYLEFENAHLPDLNPGLEKSVSFKLLNHKLSYNANDSLNLRNIVNQYDNATQLGINNPDDLSSYTFASWSIDSANSQYRLSQININSSISGYISINAVDSLKTLSFSAGGNLLRGAHGGGINQLNISQAGNLQTLDCSNSQISQLDLSQVPQLMHLNCLGSPISQLDLSKCPNLQDLNCNYCILDTCLINPNTRLKTLDCAYNNLTFSQIAPLLKCLSPGGSAYYNGQSPIKLKEIQKISTTFVLNTHINPLINLYSELLPIDSAKATDTTLFIWHLQDNGKDSIISVPQKSPGIFDFTDINIPGSSKMFVELENAHFPGFGSNYLKSQSFMIAKNKMSFNPHDSLCLRNFLNQNNNASLLGLNNLDDLASFTFTDWTIDSANSQYRLASIDFWAEQVSGNFDFSYCEDLSSVRLYNTAITQLNLSHTPNLKTLSCSNNQISNFILDSNAKFTSTADFSYNNLAFSALAPSLELLGAQLLYAPQNPIKTKELQSVGNNIYMLNPNTNPILDLSSEVFPIESGMATDTTQIIWHWLLSGGKDSIINIPQTSPGQFDFSHINIPNGDQVYAELINIYFPQFGSNNLQTLHFNVFTKSPIYNRHDSLILRNIINQNDNASLLNISNPDDLGSYTFASWVIDTNFEFRLSQISLSGKQISGEIDLSSCDYLAQVGIDNNRISQLNLSMSPSLQNLDCSNNNLSLSAIAPLLKGPAINRLIYAPQNALELKELTKINDVYSLDNNINTIIDLSSEVLPLITGINKASDTTKYMWHRIRNGVDQLISIPQISPGVFDFSGFNFSNNASFYVEFINPNFPNFAREFIHIASVRFRIIAKIPNYNTKDSLALRAMLSQNNYASQLGITNLDSLASYTFASWCLDSLNNEYRLSAIHLQERSLSGKLILKGCDSLNSFDCSNNNLSDLDISNNPNLKNLNYNDNQLMLAPTANNTLLNQVNCANNRLALSQIALVINQMNQNTILNYSPQQELILNSLVLKNEQQFSMDLSKDSIMDLSSELRPLQNQTSFTWHKIHQGNSSVLDIPISSPGIFNFNAATISNGDSLYLSLLNTDFPGFSPSNPLKSIIFTIENKSARPSDSLAIEKGMRTQSLHIYPNPCQSLLNIEQKGSYHWTIFNSLGIIQLEGNGKDGSRIKLGLPNGIYYIRLEDASKQVKNAKFIILNP